MKLHQIVVTIICVLIMATMATAIERGGGTASTGSAICNPEDFSITDVDTIYAYGCIDSTHARSCRQSDGTLISGYFEIPSSNPLSKKCSSASATSSSAGPSSRDCPKCKEIDAVWERIRGVLRLAEDRKDKLWERGWKTFNVIYGPPPATYEGVEGADAFDDLIRFSANQYGLEARAIKAIMLQESSGQPYAISNTGCAGLMQICFDSAPKEILNTLCPQSKTDGARPCNGGTPDDRFDPQKNILAGTFILKQKSDTIGKCGNDQLKAVAAAYNAGERVVKAAIAQNGNNCNNWESLSNIITPVFLKDNGYSDEWIKTKIGSGIDPETWRAQVKVVEIKTHVQEFSTYYNSLGEFT